MPAKERHFDPHPLTRFQNGQARGKLASLPVDDHLDVGPRYDRGWHAARHQRSHSPPIMLIIPKVGTRSAMKSPGQFEHPLVARAKCEITTAALANGVVPTHNVTTELKDLDVIRNDARRARQEFGYLRMWSIHPNQIMPIVEAMRPDFSEVETAAAIVIAAQDKDWAPIAHEGKLHDRASYRYYWELLARAHATGMTLPGEAQTRFFA